MNHYERFHEIVATQLIACSRELRVETFKDWMLEIQKEKRFLDKVIIFFEEGYDEKDIDACRDLYTEYLHLSKMRLEIVRDVPHDEIQQMLELTNKINGST